MVYINLESGGDGILVCRVVVTEYHKWRGLTNRFIFLLPWKLEVSPGGGRFGFFEGSEGESAPCLPTSLLAILGIPCLADVLFLSLPSSSHGIPPACV